MKLPRRQFLHLAVGGAAVPAMSRIAWAQTHHAHDDLPADQVLDLDGSGGGSLIQAHERRHRLVLRSGRSSALGFFYSVGH